MTLLAILTRQPPPDPGPEPFPWDEIPDSAPYNMPLHLVTPTYDGSGCTIHPDVVDMGEKWHGFQYWMAHTPYPLSQNRLENPSILASNDAVTWEEPPGIVNPIYPKEVGHYNSDCDLSYDPDEDELVLIYRAKSSQGIHMIARSPDGVTWPAQATVLDGWETPQQNLSPAMVRMGDGLWAMWGLGSNPRTLRMWTAPVPDGPWALPVECNGLSGRAWHLDVTRIGGRLYGIIAHGKEGQPQYHGLYAASSDNGVDWVYNETPVIEHGPDGAWDGGALYRSTIQPHPNGTHMRLWYSGRLDKESFETSWHIGYTEIPLTEWPDP